MGGAIGGIAAVTVTIAVIAVIAYWIYRLAQWDGDDRCDETQCDTCPFPCEKHKNR